MPNWYGQWVYCQFGESKRWIRAASFVSAQRIFAGDAFTFRSHLADWRSEAGEINGFVRSVNELGRKVVGLTAWIFALAGISGAHPQ